MSRHIPSATHMSSPRHLTSALAITGVAAVAMMTSACSRGPNNAEAGTAIGAIAGGIIGNQVGDGFGRAVATATGAFVGGIVGHTIGQSLDEQDRRYAQEAEYRALQADGYGEPVEWRNPETGRYGQVVPRRDFEDRGRRCREFEHTVYIDGQPEVMVGTACRNPDGTWSNVG